MTVGIIGVRRRRTAKTEVGAFFAAAGFAVIDLGDLRAGGRLQQVGGPLAGKDLVLMP